MKRQIRVTGVFVLTVLALSPAFTWDLDLADRARLLLSPGDYFAAAIVQNDELDPVNGRVLVNASPSPEFYNGIRKNLPLDEILETPDMFMGMAEYLFNEDRTMFASRVFPHYLFFSSFTEHRYDFVHLTPDAVPGYRSVDYLLDIDGDTGRYSITEWNGPLYLRFYSTRYDDGSRVELQRETAKVEFR